MSENSKIKLGATWSPLIFNLNQANMATPEYATQVSANGWNPNDETKSLYANDMNIFMYRTNFSGDLKTVKTISTGTLLTIPTSGQVDCFYFYNVTVAGGNLSVMVNTDEIPAGTTIKILNSGDLPLKISSNQTPDILLNTAVFENYVIELLVLSPTKVIVKNIAPPDLPIANTGQVVHMFSQYFAGSVDPRLGFASFGASLGNETSGADVAGFFAYKLYFIYWVLGSMGSTGFTVSGGRGATPIADFNAGKTITTLNANGFLVRTEYATDFIGVEGVIEAATGTDPIKSTLGIPLLVKL